jgi:hypothetical protein
MSTTAKKRKKKSTALDKIAIRRPIPSPEVLQDMKPEAQPPTVVNPEFEEKPLAEFDLRTSEDMHGGSELTFSMPSLQGGGGAQQQEGGGGGGAKQHAAQQGSALPQQESQQTAGSESQQQQEAQQYDVSSQQQQAESISQQQDSQHVDPWKQYYMSKLEKDAEEKGDVRELGRNVKTGGSGSHMDVGGYNTAQVVDLKTKTPQRPELRRLQTEFYRILEMLAEEKTKYFDPSLVGSMAKAEYNVKKMAMRRYEGKPPTRYKAPRVREAVVLVLDNSGSMASWADMLRAMAELAAKRRDVEVYLAPNGYVEEQIAPVTRKVKHDEFMKKMSGRKIIYVGDFDGTNTPVELSWRNEVIWIAPEDRYRRFLSHSWVKYDESKYKGAFVRTFTIDGTMKALKKVLGGAKWIDTCVKCKEDE